MSRHLTFSLSALFLLVTIVGVMAAIVSSPSGARQFLTILDTNDEAHYQPAIIAILVSGVLGLVVMAYNSLEWEMLVVGFGAGAAVGMVALRLLLWPFDFRVVLGGIAAMLAYGVLIRVTTPKPASNRIDTDDATA